MSAPTRAVRYADDVDVGEPLPEVAYPLPVYRLVMAAGATRDFNRIHHNTAAARDSGAEEMYASTAFLLGTWERAVRDWIGEHGTIQRITGFRMRAFNYAGTTMHVRGEVTAVDLADGRGRIDLSVRSESNDRVTVGPGTVTVTLPRRPGSPS